MGFSRYGKQTKIRMINQPCYILHFEFVLPVPMYCKLDSSVSPTAVKIQLEFLQSIGPKFSVKLTDLLSQIVSPESRTSEEMGGTLPRNASFENA